MSLSHLNAEQQAAAAAVRGPVVIIAGAGTGKTTTVTHRIAQQVRTGAFEPTAILAVTFTRKAAQELRDRLVALGVRGVQASTFHALAFRIVRDLWSEHESPPVGDVIARKDQLLGPIMRSLPGGYRYRSAADVATALEFARNRRLDPSSLPLVLQEAGIDLPLPAELLLQVIADYEAAKREQGLLDFEDLLERAIHLIDAHPGAAERVRSRIQAITVDEYQDVNPLQQALLEHVLGERDDICVVGDDHQTIYTFTGATPQYLLEFGRRHPGAQVVTLTRNYRSTPQVLDVANRIAQRIGGHPKQLVATLADGPSVGVERYANTTAETQAIARRCQQLADAGTPLDEIAVLYRTNVQSVDFETELGRLGLPVQVQGRPFLERMAATQVRRHVESRGLTHRPARALVPVVASEVGYDLSATPRAGSAEHVRQADLERLVELAAQAGPEISYRDWIEQLGALHAGADGATGINLLTIHMAKGLEWDVVFLPQLINGTLPYWKGQQKAPIDEERRLLFVGTTRARRELHMSYAPAGKGTPSLLLVEAELVPATATVGSPVRPSSDEEEELEPRDRALFDALRAWRLDVAAGKPAYTVLDNKTLRALAQARPGSERDLLQVPGIGPSKLERYGAAILSLVAADSR